MLAQLIMRFDSAIEMGQFDEAGEIFRTNTAAIWFGKTTEAFSKVVALLAEQCGEASSELDTWYRAIAGLTSGRLDNPEFLSSFDEDRPYQMFILAVIRMSMYRLVGQPAKALEQTLAMRELSGKLPVVVDNQGGWVMHSLVQTGVSAMLAGDFTLALGAFMEAQLHVPVPGFSFLRRDAMTKSALIHAASGDPVQARTLLDRAEQIPRTSSWVEDHVDVHRNITEILLQTDTPEQAIADLERLDLHDLGEMWPFLILATFRILEVVGSADELEWRMQMFDSMSFPRDDGQGFSGSVIPLYRAVLAAKSGRAAESREHLERIDKRITFSKIGEATIDVISGRPRTALATATQLREETRGLRLFELRRLSILATAQIQLNDSEGAVETLRFAASIPRGLTIREAAYFSDACWELAEKHVEKWPVLTAPIAATLGSHPSPSKTLSNREVEIVAELAKGGSRSEIAARQYVSINTLKTQLNSIYRKLEVSSAKQAVLEAQRRGII